MPTSSTIRFAVQEADKSGEGTESRVYPKEFVQFGFEVAHTHGLSRFNVPDGMRFDFLGGSS